MTPREEAMRLILRRTLNDGSISKATGVPCTTVQYMRRQAGLPPVRRHEDAQRRAKAILVALEEGPLTVRQLMTRLSLSETVVRRHLGRLLEAEQACVEDLVQVSEKRGPRWAPRWTVWPDDVPREGGAC